MSRQDEQTIIRNFREGNDPQRAFREIVVRYQERLYWHIRKIVISHEDADDVLQNTFIKVFESLSRFRADASLYTWLYRIATNEALSFLKKQKNRKHYSYDEFGSGLENSLEGDTWFDGDEMQLKLQKAILRLPDKQRVVFNMKYYEEMKYEEISSILGTSVGALKASYHHAVKKLEKYLSED